MTFWFGEFSCIREPGRTPDELVTLPAGRVGTSAEGEGLFKEMSCNTSEDGGAGEWGGGCWLALERRGSRSPCLPWSRLWASGLVQIPAPPLQSSVGDEQPYPCNLQPSQSS